MIRVGFLGAGGFAGQHAKRLRGMEGVEVVAACARSRASAEKFVAEHGAEGGEGGRAYDDFDAMLREAGLDALYVVLPPGAHEGQVERAAERGVHLFLEKPIALTVERGESMARAIEKAGVRSFVGYHLRFTEPVRRLKAMMEGGEAGTPTLFDATWVCNALHGGWWRDVTQSGGQLFEQVVHLYDLAMHLMGQPAWVSATMSRLCHEDVPDYTVEDTSAAVIRFASGAVASITGSNCAVPTQWRSEARVVCRNVVAELAPGGGNEATFTHTRGMRSEDVWRTGAAIEKETVPAGEDPYLEEAKHFLAVVRGEAESLTPVQDGLASLRLVDAAVRSAEADGQPMQLIHR